MGQTHFSVYDKEEKKQPLIPEIYYPSGEENKLYSSLDFNEYNPDLEEYDFDDYYDDDSQVESMSDAAEFMRLANEIKNKTGEALQDIYKKLLKNVPKERQALILSGLVLGGSGYMLRDKLYSGASSMMQKAKEGYREA